MTKVKQLPFARPAAATDEDDALRATIEAVFDEGKDLNLEMISSRFADPRQVERSAWRLAPILEGTHTDHAARRWALSWFSVVLLRDALGDPEAHPSVQRLYARAARARRTVGEKVRGRAALEHRYLRVREALERAVTVGERLASRVFSLVYDEEAPGWPTTAQIDRAIARARAEHGRPWSLPEVSGIEDPDDPDNPWLRDDVEKEQGEEIRDEIEERIGLYGARMVLRWARRNGACRAALARWAQSAGLVADGEAFSRALGDAWDVLSDVRSALEGLAVAAGHPGEIMGSLDRLLAWARRAGLVDDRLAARVCEGSPVDSRYAGD
jgi:hypothetical protein